jgi:hypothetical protein
VVRRLWTFADVVACDQVISGEKAERNLGWHPSKRSIVDERRFYPSTAACGRRPPAQSGGSMAEVQGTAD